MPSTPAGSSGSSLSLEELAHRLGARVEGSAGRGIEGVAPIDCAAEGQLTFLGHPRYFDQLSSTKASAALVAADANVSPTATCSLLRVPDVYDALAEVLELFYPEPRPEPGVHESAAVHPSATLGEGVTVGAGAAIDAGAQIGARCILHAGAIVGKDAELGESVVLHPRVVVYPGTSIGDRVVVHAGSVLGSDGFGYTPKADGLRKVPQVGRLVIEADVEIGANCALDRGSIGETRIGRGTKIDNLCHIAHNVQVGPHCILVGQSGIAGSSTLDSGVVVAGQSGVSGHLHIGPGARIAAKSAVFQDLEGGATVAGSPGIDINRWKRSMTLLARLPDLFRRLRRLERENPPAPSVDQE